MDSEIFTMLIKIILFLPFIIALTFLTVKVGGSKLQEVKNGKYIKVIEGVSLTKENSIFVVKIGEKGYVITSSQGKIEKLMEVAPSDLEKIQEAKKIKQYKNLKEIYEKLKNKKEDHDE